MEEWDVEAALLEYGTCASPPPSETPPFDAQELLERLDTSFDCDHIPTQWSAANVAAEAAANNRQHADARLGHGTVCEEHVHRIYSDASCTLLLISFGSLAHRHGADEQPGARFEFVGAAKRIGATHALFLRDVEQAWYLRGGVDHDPFGWLMDYVLAEVERLRPTHVVCVGASMGGHAAARCALRLGAIEPSMPLRSVSALCFGAQVCLNPHERQILGLPFATFEPALDRLAERARREGFTCPSLLREVARAAQSAAVETRLEMHVGACARCDVIEARLLEEAIALASRRECATGGSGSGLSGGEERAHTHPRVVVNVHEHARSGHALAPGLRSSGQLDQLLRDELAVGCRTE